MKTPKFNRTQTQWIVSCLMAGGIDVRKVIEDLILLEHKRSRRTK